MVDELRYISSSITQEEYDEIVDYCEKYGTNRSALIRASVFHYMDTHAGLSIKRGYLSRLIKKLF